MTITRLLVRMTGSELTSAEDWYNRLFGTGPSARPMAGLLEWHPGEDFGVQMYAEPHRADRASTVLKVVDVTTEADRLTVAGIAHGGPQDATTIRILPLVDAAGNRSVFTSPLR